VKLTRKQVYDLQQLVKRKWCRKKHQACEKCVIATCKETMWFVGYEHEKVHIELQEDELMKAEGLLKQHYMVIAEDILLKGEI